MNDETAEPTTGTSPDTAEPTTTPLVDLTVNDLMEMSIDKGGRGLWTAEGPKYKLLVSVSIVEDDGVAAGLSKVLGSLLGAYGDLDDLASAVADGSLVTVADETTH